jgi:uncharacterized membrane protein
MLLVTLLWLLFAGSHIGLAMVREPLVRRLGERTFLWCFSLVAATSFSLLTAAYSVVKSTGPAGLGLATVEWARAPLIAVAAVGIVFLIGGLAPAGYWGSPYAIEIGGVRQPFGLERITRHPVTAGTVLFAGSHALLATRLTGTIYFGGFLVLGILGSAHQSRKLRRRLGDPLARYYASTSAIPFAAILAGKQRLVPSELPWITLLIGAAIAYWLRTVHESIFAWYGAPVSIAIGGGGLVISAISHWLARARADTARRRYRQPEVAS